MNLNKRVFSLILLLFLTGFITLSSNYLVSRLIGNIGFVFCLNDITSVHSQSDIAFDWLEKANAQRIQRTNYCTQLLYLIANQELLTEDDLSIDSDDDYWFLLQGISGLYYSHTRNAKICEDKCFQLVLMRNPTSSTANFYEGRRLHKQGDALQAIVFYQHALDYDDFDSRFFDGFNGWYGSEGASLTTARLYLTIAYMDLEQWGEAERSARLLMEQTQNTGDGEYLLGQILYKTNRLSEAALSLRKATEDRGDWKDYLLLGRVYAGMGQTELSMESYEKSYKLYPKGSVLRELGFLYIRHTNNKERGQKLVEQFISTLPQNCSQAGWWVASGEIFLDIPEVQLACSTFEKVSAFCPSRADARQLAEQYCVSDLEK